MFSKDGKDEESVLWTHITLYVFGDRFNIPNLQDLCLRNLSAFLQSKMDEGTFSEPMLKAVIHATNYAVENLPSLRERASGCLISCLSWLIPRHYDLTQVKQLLQQHKELEQELLNVSTPDLESSHEPAWKAGIREKGYVIRLVMTCTGCHSMSLIGKLHCRQCRRGTLASYNGWFNVRMREWCVRHDKVFCDLCEIYMDFHCLRCVRSMDLHRLTCLYRGVGCSPITCLFLRDCSSDS